MLRRLYIRDFTLIEELEVAFDAGLNIITGETGAGKSIVVGALKLILGDRASTDTLRAGARKAVIEGEFEVDLDEGMSRLFEENGIDELPYLILRREVSETHSRAFINDSPATVGLLRRVASELVDLHGQHDHQSLLRTDTHLALVDGFGGLESLVRGYKIQYDVVSGIVGKRDAMLARERELKQEHELLAFQIGEIDEVAPQEGEEERLESERRILENAERLFEATSSLFELLYNSEAAVSDLLVRARNELQNLSRIDESFEELTEEISSAHISVSETASFLQDYNSRIEFNPGRLDEIRERLIDFDRLKRKYGGTIESVLAHRVDIGSRFELAADFEGRLRDWTRSLPWPGLISQMWHSGCQPSEWLLRRRSNRPSWLNWIHWVCQQADSKFASPARKMKPVGLKWMGTVTWRRLKAWTDVHSSFRPIQGSSPCRSRRSRQAGRSLVSCWRSSPFWQRAIASRFSSLTRLIPVFRERLPRGWGIAC